MPRKDLSVIVAALPERYSTSQTIETLYDQARANPEMEVLVLMDNRSLPLGTKWRHLVAATTGRYIAVVDDDDWISRKYAPAILQAIAKSDVDQIAFESEMFVDGKFKAHCYWGLSETPRDEWEAGRLYRKTGHILPVARVHHERHPFGDEPRGADRRWAKRVLADLKTESRIGAVLYRYMKRTTNTECIDAEKRFKESKDAFQEEAATG